MHIHTPSFIKRTWSQIQQEILHPRDRDMLRKDSDQATVRRQRNQESVPGKVIWMKTVVAATRPPV